MITAMDRLAAAIKGEKSDRIPVFCNLFDQGAAELGLSLQEYYSNGEYVAEAQLKMLQKYGHDNVWSLFYVGKEAALLGMQNSIRQRRSAKRGRLRYQVAGRCEQTRSSRRRLCAPGVRRKSKMFAYSTESGGRKESDLRLYNIHYDPAGHIDGNGQMDGTSLYRAGRR